MANSKPRFRNKRNNMRNDSDGIKSQDKKVMAKANDPEWYLRTGQIAKDVASFSFNNAAGARTLLDVDNTGGDSDLRSAPLTVPGIMVIDTMPFMGVSFGPNSPVNIAAKALYTYVRHANSGHSNYDSPDLMLYIMAMDSVYAGLAHLQRAIGTANLFSQVNRYVGDALLTAQGIAPSTLRSNLANYRARLNMLILKASAFCIPNTMSLFKRHMWMYTTIYQDSPVAKCQFYLYRPDFLYKYIETSGGPGYLEPIMMNGVIATPATGEQYWQPSSFNFEQWASKIEDLLNSMIESEDINIMSGDILKAYGKENIFRLEPVTEDYVTMPFYSEEVLDQIHNTNFVGPNFRTVADLGNAEQVKQFNSASLRYTQVVSVSGNYLICAPKFAKAANLSFVKLLDMADDSPTPERVLVATRNMLHGVTSASSVEGVNGITSLDSAGSDICIQGTIFYNNVIGGVWQTTSAVAYDGLTVSATPQTEKFQKCPIGYTGTWTTGGYFQSYTPYYELGNYTVLNHADINKLHESAILSMLGVPV